MPQDYNLLVLRFQILWIEALGHDGKGSALLHGSWDLSWVDLGFSLVHAAGLPWAKHNVVGILAW